MLETIMTATRKGIKEYYMLSIVLSLVKTRLWPASAPANKGNSSDQIGIQNLLLKGQQGIYSQLIDGLVGKS
jgi:hypothetical protein